MTTDTSERGLERRIVALRTDAPIGEADPGTSAERPATYSAGWLSGDPADYDRTSAWTRPN